MGQKEIIHSLLNQISDEVFTFIKNSEAPAKDRWVPAAQIKVSLELNFVAVPRQNKQYGEKGWLFGIVARMLEDQERVEYKKIGNKAYYRSKK
jgi:hypothetical protein